MRRHSSSACRVRTVCECFRGVVCAYEDCTYGCRHMHHSRSLGRLCVYMLTEFCVRACACAGCLLCVQAKGVLRAGHGGARR